jgi:hypothetical protein
MSVVPWRSFLVMVIEEDSVKKEKEARSIGAEVDGVDVDMVQITRSSERQRRKEGTGRRRVSALTPS